MKMKEFLLLLVNKILNSVIGGGLFCGFMTTATVGLGYFFVVASFFIKDKQFFIKDNQRRVAAMTGFVTGQFVMFTSIYNRPLHEGLVQPHSIIMLFLGSFFVQLFWTSRKTLRNRRFLDPHDLITKRKYVLRLQLEFIINFFVQLCNPYLEPDSMIPGLVNFCLSRYNNDNEKRILFVRSSLAGWLIGHILFMIFFMKLLEFILIIIIWVRKNFFESDDEDENENK
jgi:hypothetical protein